MNVRIVGRAGSRRHTGLALTGLALVALGPVAYVSLLEYPLLRASGLVGWLLLAAGIGLGSLAWRNDRRAWVSAALASEIAISVLAAFAFVVLARLPAAPSAHELVQAPDIVLTDHTGQRVSLAERLAHGPVLLVFFRGSW